MRLLAGAIAHEINNLAQGLVNVRALSGRDMSSEAIARLAERGDEQVRALEALARDLRALARIDEAGASHAHELDLILSDALVEAEPIEEVSVLLDDLPAGARVAGTADALRVAVRALLRHALAATLSGGTVRIGAMLEPGFVVATIDAPGAPAPTTEMAPLGVLSGELLNSSFDVVLAGALGAALGGELRVGPGAQGGLRFALALRRAAEV